MGPQESLRGHSFHVLIKLGARPQFRYRNKADAAGSAAGDGGPEAAQPGGSDKWIKTKVFEAWLPLGSLGKDPCLRP